MEGCRRKIRTRPIGVSEWECIRTAETGVEGQGVVDCAEESWPTTEEAAEARDLRTTGVGSMMKDLQEC